MQRNETGRDGTLAKIRQALSMPGTGSKLASHILVDPDAVTYSSITDLARRSGVSQSAIVRFCRTLGYSGYQEFRIALAKDAVDTFVAELDDVSDDDSIESVVQKVTNANIQTLRDTAQLLQPNDIERAIDAIRKAKRITIHAAGPSVAVGWEAFSKFSRIGLPASLTSDLHTQMMLAASLKPGDVALGISHSGHSIGTVEPLKAARAEGATTICITRYAQSPLTRTSDVSLFAASHNAAHPIRGRASRVSMMLIVEIICAGLGRNLDPSKLKRNRTAVERLRGLTMRAEDVE